MISRSRYILCLPVGATSFILKLFYWPFNCVVNLSFYQELYLYYKINSATECFNPLVHLCRKFNHSQQQGINGCFPTSTFHSIHGYTPRYISKQLEVKGSRESNSAIQATISEFNRSNLLHLIFGLNSIILNHMTHYSFHIHVQHGWVNHSLS